MTYEDGRGVLRDPLTTCTAGGWTIDSMAVLGWRADVVASETPAARLVTEPDSVQPDPDPRRARPALLPSLPWICS